MDTELSTVLSRLLLLADVALADKIIEIERLKSARHRVLLHERQELHMCFRPGCRNPVEGNLIYTCCERHLFGWEKGWYAEDLENNLKTLEEPTNPDESKHSSVLQIESAYRHRVKELIKQNVAKKQEALSVAYELLRNQEEVVYERRACLPSKLRTRIEYATREALVAAGYRDDDDD